MLGDVLTRIPQFSKEFKTLINWVDKKRKLLIRTNADSPVAAHILSGAVFESGSMHNKGNYIASLGNVCRWLAGQAEALEAEIFPGFGSNLRRRNPRRNPLLQMRICSVTEVSPVRGVPVRCLCIQPSRVRDRTVRPEPNDRTRGRCHHYNRR